MLILEQLGYVSLYWTGFFITIAAIIAVVRKDHGDQPDPVKVHRFGKDAGLVAAFGVILAIASPYAPAWWEVVEVLLVLGAALAVAWRKEKEKQAA